MARRFSSLYRCVRAAKVQAFAALHVKHTAVAFDLIGFEDGAA